MGDISGILLKLSKELIVGLIAAVIASAIIIRFTRWKFATISIFCGFLVILVIVIQLGMSSRLITSVNPQGGGYVTPRSGFYEKGNTLDVAATAAAGYQFDHWSGDLSDELPTVHVSMNSNKKLTANFSLAPVKDDFSNPNSGWEESSTKDWEQKYENGVFSSIVKSNLVALSGNTTVGNQSDFVAEIDAKIMSSETSACGLCFREKQIGPKRYLNGYSFFINGKGDFQVGKWVQGEWKEFQAWTPSIYILTGTNINRLKVTCSGTRTEVYVNGNQMLAFTDNDSDFSSGYICLVAEYQDTIVQFDNFTFSVSN
jgi:hypothetical protein